MSGEILPLPTPSSTSNPIHPPRFPTVAVASGAQPVVMHFRPTPTAGVSYGRDEYPNHGTILDPANLAEGGYDSTEVREHRTCVGRTQFPVPLLLRVDGIPCCCCPPSQWRGVSLPTPKPFKLASDASRIRIDSQPTTTRKRNFPLCCLLLG